MRRRYSRLIGLARNIIARPVLSRLANTASSFATPPPPPENPSADSSKGKPKMTPAERAERLSLAHEAVMVEDARGVLATARRQVARHFAGEAQTEHGDDMFVVGDVTYQQQQSPQKPSWLPYAAALALGLGGGGLAAALPWLLSDKQAAVAPVVPVTPDTPGPAYEFRIVPEPAR